MKIKICGNSSPQTMIKILVIGLNITLNNLLIKIKIAINNIQTILLN